jgi:putative ABC transport system permease protein
LTYDVVPVLDIHLGGPELTGMNSSGDVKLLTTLATAAFALLAVSAFNYVTLSLARSLRRRREVAVRKVLGASQGTLVVHYIAESAIVTAISLAVGFALAFLLAPWFARMIGQPETLFDLGDPAFLVGTLVAFVLLAFAVGGYPAFYLAHTRPRTALGEGGSASHGRVGQWVTGGLMGLQISAAAALLIVSMTMNAQADYIANRSMGYEVKDRYQVSISCFVSDIRTPPEKIAQMMTRCRTATRSVLSQMKDIDKPAYFNGALMTDSVTLQPFGRAAQGEKLGEAARMTVDLTFLETLGSTLLAGRLFDPNSAYDGALIAYNDEMQAAAVTEVRRSQGGISIMTRPPPNFKPTHTRPTRVPVVITRALVPMLGVQTPQEAIGMQISNQPNAQYPYEIIGVIEDWNQRPLKYAVHPIIFMPGSSQNAVIRIDKDRVDSVRDEIAQMWKNMSGETTTPSLRPLQQTLEQSYRSDFQLMSAVTSFALVAIIVAGMGVFGLSAFEMRRRVREIGIRKALGASPAKVALLVIGRAMAFAAIATVVAWPIGLLIANEWLSGFVYRTSLGPVVLPIASAAVIAFVGAAVAFSAIRAAAIRPGLALRV